MSCRGLGRLAVAVATLAGLLGGCSSPKTSTGPTGPAAPAVTTTAGFTARGSMGQAYVEGATPGETLVLADGSGRVVGKGVADRFGSLVIRDLAPGPGYRFEGVTGSRVAGSIPFPVLGVGSAPSAAADASQTMKEGLNYIAMRDGIELAATVRLPAGKTLADGPFPTVIEFSGYQIAAPDNLLTTIFSGKNDPLAPSTSTAVGSLIAPLLGFATVSLQMRGSGCSGGAFGLFDLPNTYDGYDAVQIVGSQSWVAHHQVGMVGISFSGISQLFVAGTRPPDLAAIAPFSTTDDLWSTGDPGGIFNAGFAASWITERASDALPAPDGGQPWAKALVAAGDQHCIANQRLRLQTLDGVSLMQTTKYRIDSLFDPRSPSNWAKQIDVPVFLVGAFQDEQTGGQWPALVASLSADPTVWVTMVNGTHADSLGPATLTRWVEFLHLFVADDLPSAPAGVAGLSGVLYQKLAGAPSEALPAVRFSNAPDLATARKEFEQDPRVRVLFDNGGVAGNPGALQPEWEGDFTAWPPPAAVPTTLALGDGGMLVAALTPPKPGTVSFQPDPSARPATDLPEGNVWAALPPYIWAPVTGSTGVGFISAPLSSDLTVVGPGSMNLWLESTAPDTDLQVTVSEVRPDGSELFIQSGLLRASDRTLDPSKSTPADPVPTYQAADASPLPAGKFTEVRIPIFPFAYSFRTGSRIRVTVEAPGGDRPSWSFDSPATGGTVTDTLSIGGTQASALVLSVVPGLNPPDPQPACPSLRGEPCRSYLAAGNGG